MDDVVSGRGVANGQTICIDMSTSLLPKGIPGGSADQRHSQDFGVVGTGSVGGSGLTAYYGYFAANPCTFCVFS